MTALLLTVVLAASLCTGILVPASAVTMDEIQALQDKAGDLAREKQALNEKISALSDDISANIEKKELLDGQIAVIQDELDNLGAEIAVYEEQIAEVEAELADAREREEAKKELFRKRVRAMEEQGRIDYWAILLRANSFTDLLTRLDFVNEIMTADQQIMLDLRALQQEISEREAELEAKKGELVAVQAAEEAKKAELDRERDAANQLVIELQQSRDQAELDMDDLSASEENVQEEIVELSRQYAQEVQRKQAEAAAAAAREAAKAQQRYSASSSTSAATASMSSGTASGGYIWPVDSRKINSTFGGRSSPGGIGSRNHKGIDIGGVGYGTAVHAAKSGVVIVSQYHSSYGNYVVVSHGSGNTTLYAHLSKRLVSVGEAVSQGTTLGLTGSTGQSTGPHLHFEITENGSRVNPLNYLGGYYLSH